VALLIATGLSSALPAAYAAPAEPIVDSNGVTVPDCTLPYVSGVSASCYGADLTGYDLSTPPFVDVRWESAVLERANLDGRTFPDGTDFSGADLAGASFRSVSAVGAYFNNAGMQLVDATGATLTGARLWQTSARDATFVDANLTNAQFNMADLTGADFTGADLTGARIYADVTGAIFTDAIGVDLTGSTGTPLAGPPGYTPPPPPPAPDSGPISLAATPQKGYAAWVLKTTWTNTSSTSSFDCTFEARPTDAEGNYNNLAPYPGPTVTVSPNSAVDLVQNAGVGPLGLEWQCAGGDGTTDNRLLSTTGYLGLVRPTRVTIPEPDPDLSVPPPVVPKPGFGSVDLTLFGSS
jgi:uncharacterized protein YjbI with pentapeptide repeats